MHIILNVKRLLVIFSILIILIVSFGCVAAENSTDNSSLDSDDEATDVEFDLDVIYDDVENSTDNGTHDGDVHSSHKISLNHYATSNPIFMALFVMIVAILIPLRRRE